MDPKKILLMTIPIAVLLSAICVILPYLLGEAGRIYTFIAMPVALMASVAFGLKVAFTYQRDLRKTFLFLSFFLLVTAAFVLMISIVNLSAQIYGSIPPQLMPMVHILTGSSLLLEILTGAMLILSCVYTLKVITVKHMTQIEWLAIGFLLVLGLIIVLEPITPVLAGAEITAEILQGMLHRFVGVATAMILVPVLFLYGHQLRGEAKESVTFALIVIGIIFSTNVDYVYSIGMSVISGISYAEVAGTFQTGSILDSLFLMGWLTINAGLFIHMNYSKWSLKSIGGLDFSTIDLSE